MGRSKVVNFQLFLLLVLTAIVGYSALRKPPVPAGNLVQSRLDTGRLYHDELILESESKLLIESVGSLETLDPNSELLGTMAAFPWILNRATREVEWILRPGSSDGTKTLVEKVDSVQLGPGTYDVFFTTLGQTRESRRRQIVGHRGQWIGDKDKWQMVIHATSAAGGDIRVDDHVDWAEVAPTSDNLVWASGPVKGKQKVEQVFEVSETIPVVVYTVGEICANSCDYGYVTELRSDSVLWRMNESNSTPAGGANSNRLFKGEIVLKPGLYKIGYVTDYGHDFDRWYHNPPFDPTAWGITVSASSAADLEKISALDLWTQRQPSIFINQVRDDQEIERYFTVSKPIRVFLSGLGELSKSDSRYDFAELSDRNTGKIVWSMSWENSQPAGGHDNNRIEEVYRSLVPGSYKLSYKSDGSHSFERFSNGTPRNPDRWGVAMFVIDDDGDSIVVSEEPQNGDIVVVDESQSGDVIVNETRLGNSVDLEQIIAVSEPSTLSIFALGEISRSEAYDYGWIVDANGDEIWRMTRSNTSFAGGVDRNRMYTGRIDVEAGVYILHFQTDSGHAFGDFGSDGPNVPERWGIVVRSAPSGAIE